MNGCIFPYSPAVPPPVAVEPFETSTTVYTFDGSETYTVKIGNEFSVLCSSFGTFIGRVTWIKLENGGENW